MNKPLSGTRTEKNLWAAFNGESAARTKYQLYAMQARKDSLQKVAAIFDETADNELQHAKLWLRALNALQQTDENLKKAQEGEQYEWTTMYVEFERVAREEGFDAIADQFQRAGQVEHAHDNRYAAYQKALKEQALFKKDTVQTWKCMNCGYQHIGTDAPETCPLCHHPQGWFEAMPPTEM